jgi:signal transduction histidine kinase
MKSAFRLNSIKKKTVLSIILVIVVCASVAALAVDFIVEYQMSGKYRAEKEAAVESLSYTLRPILDEHSYGQLEQIIAASLIYENISYIAVFDSTGTQIESLSDEDIAAENLEIESHDVSVNGQKIGSFEIGFSRDYIDSFSDRTTLILIIILIGFLLLAGVSLFIFMGQSVIRPIERFTANIRKIGPENLSVRMQVDTGDEIGTLATSFNRMAEDLENSNIALREARDDLEKKVELRTAGERRRAEQLRAINEVSRRISAILSLDELLPYVANSLQQTFEYYNVNIFMVDDVSGNPVLKAGAGGYREKAPEGFIIPISEGIIGSAVASGEPLNIGDVNNEPRYVASEELPGTRSELAVPIKIGTETLGVLDLQSTSLDAFDEIDVFTAQTLADQLAVAIENARLYRETRDIAVLEERNRLAREIHDTLAQGFTGIVLQLEAAEQALENDASHAQEHIDKARRLARESLNEARRSVWALRPKALEQDSLITTMRQLMDELSRDTDVTPEFSISGKEYALPADIEDAILRIFQESLTNIKKHAGASKLKAALVIREKSVVLSIEDDGVGFDTSTLKHGRFGLISMRERVKLLGGSFDIISEKAKGTRIVVTIPVKGVVE